MAMWHELLKYSIRSFLGLMILQSSALAFSNDQSVAKVESSYLIQKKKPVKTDVVDIGDDLDYEVIKDEDLWFLQRGGFSKKLN